MKTAQLGKTVIFYTNTLALLPRKQKRPRPPKALLPRSVQHRKCIQSTTALFSAARQLHDPFITATPGIRSGLVLCRYSNEPLVIKAYLPFSCRCPIPGSTTSILPYIFDSIICIVVSGAYTIPSKIPDPAAR